ncbi:MAG TPA: response regulator transcription factor [Agriterribacter sp.]|nr:response regulator transcription factor [Agriterribacter sp.]HRQ49453.1 response regulator transcription factor [Agriterribacter sp.]
MFANPLLPVTIAIADDHILVRKAIISLINNSERFKIVLEAENGKELLEKIGQNQPPDIILLDINMPVMNGFETMKAINKTVSNPKVIALTAFNDEVSIFRLYKAGISAYILKTFEPGELFLALEAVAANDTYYPEPVYGKLIYASKEERCRIVESLNERETLFLKYAAMDIPYSEVAVKMNLGKYSINDYQKSLYQKFGVNSRIGMVLLAVKYKIVEI